MGVNDSFNDTAFNKRLLYHGNYQSQTLPWHPLVWTTVANTGGSCPTAASAGFAAQPPGSVLPWDAVTKRLAGAGVGRGPGRHHCSRLLRLLCRPQPHTRGEWVARAPSPLMTSRSALTRCWAVNTLTDRGLGGRIPFPMRYVGVASLSAGVLLLELTLTRIYSVTQGYHFAFLAVSLGLLGFGTSGTLLFLAPRLWRGGGRLLLASSAGLFSLTAVGSYWALDVIPFDAYLLVVEPSMFVYLALFYLVPAVPFLFAGLALGGALSMDPGRAARLYGASLTGSGIGALLALGGPAANGPGDALAAVSLLGAAALLALSVGAGVTRMAAAAAASMALAAAGLVLPQVVELEMSQYKTLPRVLDQVGSTLEWTGWNAFSRVDFVSADALHQAPGLSFAFSGALPRQSAMTTDGDNLTSLTASSPADAEFTAFLPGAVAYRLVELPRVLVIEPGGGLDVLTALHHGAREVVAVVGNPLEAELLRGRAAEAAGGVFESPQVTVVQANPRTYLARHDDRFDVVVVSLRDAFRPITAGAYSLSENYLYTTEAFRDYVEHLVPNGVLVVTRWAQLPPSEEMRAAAGLIEAIEDGRRTDADGSLAAIRTLQTLTVVAKNGVFSAGELQTDQGIRRVAAHGPGVSAGPPRRRGEQVLRAGGCVLPGRAHEAVGQGAARRLLRLPAV